MKVSVCIPVFNGEQYLNECLNSILFQTFRDFELIISDDQSTDSSLKIIDDFLLNNPCINHRVIVNENRGIGRNWNNCLSNASGEYIKFLFQDDVLKPTCLQEMVMVLEKNNKIGLVASKREFILESNCPKDINEWIFKYFDLQFQIDGINESVTLINKKLFKKDYFLQTPMNKIGEPSVVMFRKSVINKVGLFRTDLLQVLDFEYWYRILKYYDVAIINKPLVLFRLHSQQTTNINRNRTIQDYTIYEKIIFYHFFLLINSSLRKKLFLKLTLIGRLILKIYKWILQKKIFV